MTTLRALPMAGFCTSLLGPQTTQIAEAMKRYNADSTWRKAQPETSKR